VLPENTWLTSIEEVEGKSIVINGMTEADAEVGQIMNRLLNSPSVSNVILVEMKDIGRNGLQKSFMIQHSFVQTSVD
jgi:Tfp pilus assembly protein PilN